MRYILLFLTFVMLAVVLVGCLSQVPPEPKYAQFQSSSLGFSFEAPGHWVRQSDPLAFVRFGEANSSSFAVTLSANSTADDLDRVSTEIFNSFSQNKGLSNLSKQNVVVAGMYAVKISGGQAATTSTPLAASDLFVVKDTANNRLLLLAFVYAKGDKLEYNRKIQQHILNSFNISRAS